MVTKNAKVRCIYKGCWYEPACRLKPPLEEAAIRMVLHAEHPNHPPRNVVPRGF